MVQFLKDPVFNTSLIVGYYWIPLTILCILYSFIFEAAWRLSKKSQDKDKERQKLLALAKKPTDKGGTNPAVGIAAVAMTASLTTSKPVEMSKTNGQGQKQDEPVSKHSQDEISGFSVTATGTSDSGRVNKSNGISASTTNVAPPPASYSNPNNRPPKPLPPVREESTLSTVKHPNVPSSLQKQSAPPYVSSNNFPQNNSISSSNKYHASHPLNHQHHHAPPPTTSKLSHGQQNNYSTTDSANSSVVDGGNGLPNRAVLPEPMKPSVMCDVCCKHGSKHQPLPPNCSFDVDSFQNSDPSTLTPTPAATPSPSVSPGSTLTPEPVGVRPRSLNIRPGRLCKKHHPRPPSMFGDDDMRFMDESSVAMSSPMGDTSEEGVSNQITVPEPMSPLSPFDQKSYLYGRPIRKYHPPPVQKTNLPLPIMGDPSPTPPDSQTTNEDDFHHHHAHYNHHHHFQQDMALPHYRDCDLTPCQSQPGHMHGPGNGHAAPESDDAGTTSSPDDGDDDDDDDTTISSGSDCGECCAGHAPYPYHPRVCVSGATSTVSRSTQISPTSVMEMYSAAQAQRQHHARTLNKVSKKLSFQLACDGGTTSDSGTDKGSQTPIIEHYPGLPLTNYSTLPGRSSASALGCNAANPMYGHFIHPSSSMNALNVAALPPPLPPPSNSDPLPAVVDETPMLPRPPGPSAPLASSEDPGPEASYSMSASGPPTVGGECFAPAPPPHDNISASSSNKVLPSSSTTAAAANGNGNEIEQAANLPDEDPSSQVTASGADLTNGRRSADSKQKKDIMRKIGKRIRFRKKKDKFKAENRAKKALKTISVILGAFVACWTPYHVFAIIASFCPTCINVHLYMFSYFLCYLNSPINPFCYAASNQQFKNAFKRIMKGDLSMK